MKVLYLLIPLFMASACKTQTSSVSTSETKTMKQLETASSDCPKEGTCEIKVFQNKNLEIKEGDNGRLYTQIVDGTNIVIEHTYFRKGPQGTADGNYYESLQFEVPSSAQNLKKDGSSLADVNAVFGKQAYRNSEYYRVTDGKLSYKKSGNNITFDLKYNIDQTSQEIDHIKGSSILK